jgi:hypothetical protein
VQALAAMQRLRLHTEPDSLDDRRGLVVVEGDFRADLRPITFTVITDIAPTVELKPGEDTTVAVAVPGLPRNADVKKIEAKLIVAASAQQGPPETTNVSVTSQGGTQAFGVAVDAAPLPRNVQVSLAGGEVFWDHAGTLPTGEHSLGDFADAVNSYLDSARLPDGPTTLSFLVHSDTPGVVSIPVDEDSLEYTVLQTQAWPNPLDGSVRIDRNLELDFGDVIRIPLDPLAGVPSKALPLAGLRLDVSGEPGPERLLGDVPAHDGREFATVSADYAIAQMFTVTSGAGTGLGFQSGGVVRVAGVVAVVAVDADAELYLELEPDAGGAPSSGPPPGAANFQLAPQANDGGAWIYAALPAPVEVPVDTPHWIILRSIQGAARLAIAEPGGDYLGELLVNRGGQLWKPLVRGGPVALARIAYLPEPDNETAPVAIGLEGRPSQRPDVSGQVQRLTLEAGDATAPGVLVVTSHSRGPLSLSNVVQEFGEGARP